MAVDASPATFSLVLSDSSDIHATQIAATAGDLGRLILHVPTDRFMTDWSIDIQQEDTAVAVELTGPEGTFTFGGSEGRNLDAVWVRRPTPPKAPPGLEPEDARWASGETLEVLLEALYAGSPHTWVNHPSADHKSRRRLVQLRAAARNGFKVPATIITQSPETALEFLKTHQRVAYKPLTNAFLDLAPGQTWAYGGPTRLITADGGHDFETVAVCATQLQQYIDKRFEYRVTVVGASVITARIDSQSSPVAQIDYRVAETDIVAQLVSRPEVEAMARNLVAGFGLQYAAMDLIEDRDGAYWFLDLNPSGQFLFIDLVTETPTIETAMINLLTRSAPHLEVI